MEGRTMINGMDFSTFMEKYPHNTDCKGRFEILVYMCYNKCDNGMSLEEFINLCLSKYGGTIADSLIDYLYNNS
jgi:hypothetical protein